MPPTLRVVAKVKHKLQILLKRACEKINNIKKKPPTQKVPTSTLTTFHLFPFLPPELQIIIFTTALAEIPPRVLKLRYHATFQPHHGQNHIRFSTNSFPHFFLSFSQTSRAAMTIAYSAIAQPGLDRVIRFHPYDTVYMTMMPVSDLFGQKMNFHTYPIFPHTITSPERKIRVDENVANMLNGIKNLAIPLGWLGLKLSPWEDDLTKSLFLAHFVNLTTLMLVGPDLHKYATDMNGREKEVYLHDQTEWEMAIHGYKPDEECEEISVIRASGDREDFLAKAESALYRDDKVSWPMRGEFAVALMCSSYEEEDLRVMCQRRRERRGRN